MSIDDLKTRIRTGPGRLRSAAAVSVAGLGLLAGTVYAGAPADLAEPGFAPVVAEQSAIPAAEPTDADMELAELEAVAARVNRVNGAWAELSSYYEENVAPIEQVLLRYSRDTALVQRISVALVREANRVELEPRLLLAVLLVENPWLDPEIRSPVGAIGLMQIMPVHRGGWSECDQDLEDVDANICHGASIFAHYFRASNQNLDRALLRYNGCVRGTNTPNCHQYPNHVFAHAGRASVMAWLGQGPGAGSP
jgi:soluble lytic murein transglycosylase-like protein